jgi:hypothetical protein
MHNIINILLCNLDTILRNRDTFAISSAKDKAMKSANQRVKRYRSEGGAADLARVEVLVPPSARQEILAVAARLRAEHRRNKELRALYDDALASYRVRILDNIDLDRLPDFRSRAAVVARAMIDRGDARAFAMGRQMLERLGAS